MTPLQADAIIVCLETNGVRYVLIGGLAAILHGSSADHLRRGHLPGA